MELTPVNICIAYQGGEQLAVESRTISVLTIKAISLFQAQSVHVVKEANTTMQKINYVS